MGLSNSRIASRGPFRVVDALRIEYPATISSNYPTPVLYTTDPTRREESDLEFHSWVGYSKLRRPEGVAGVCVGTTFRSAAHVGEAS